MKELDRNRKYGVVYGHAVYHFMQDGVYFDAQGKVVGGKEKASTAKASEDPPQVVENTADNSPRIAKLNKMAIPKLKRLVKTVSEQLGIDAPEGGKGAKARYVRFLVDNTTD
jgi:hypothetical protein